MELLDHLILQNGSVSLIICIDNYTNMYNAQSKTKSNLLRCLLPTYKLAICYFLNYAIQKY